MVMSIKPVVYMMTKQPANKVVAKGRGGYSTFKNEPLTCGHCAVGDHWRRLEIKGRVLHVPRGGRHTDARDA